MPKIRLLLIATLLCAVAPFAPAMDALVDPLDTKLLTQPAISASHLAFIYAGDLFVADRSGANVRRLTTDDGVESNPVFSPDGKLIAFSASYDGNVDVYTMPVTGGAPTRLTWHPGADSVQSFTPDGNGVLFTSQRAAYTNRYLQLFTVPLAGGMATQLPIPNAAQATYSPDGRYIAYNPIGRAFEQWKGYRGGRVSQLWLIDTRTWDIEKIPQPAGRSNDVDPMWLEGDGIWFRSDRDGEFNLYRYDRKSKQVTPVTGHKDFPVMAASGQSMRIVYEQAGHLHLLDCGRGKAQRLTIGVAADLALLDSGSVVFPVEVRGWRDGDRMRTRPRSHARPRPPAASGDSASRGLGRRGGGSLWAQPLRLGRGRGRAQARRRAQPQRQRRRRTPRCARGAWR